MKKKYIPKYYNGGKAKLPKYPDGTLYQDPNMGMYSQADQQALNGSTNDVYNQKRGLTGNQYAQYGQAALSTGSQLMANQDLTGQEKQMANSQAVNSGVDSVAGSALPWYGAAMGASGVGRSMVKKDAEGNIANSNGRATDALFKPIHQQQIDAATKGNWGDFIGSTLGAGFYAPIKAKFNKNYEYRMGGKMCYPNGGMMPNAEVELTENSVAPNGEFTQYNGPSHEAGGVPTNLDNGEMVFSDRLKMPGTKKTFATLNKINNTSKEDKVLTGDSINKVSKTTAELMKFAKNKASKALFDEQENFKQIKLSNYAKRLGINPPSSMDVNEYSKGGIHINPANKGKFTASANSAGMGVQEFASHVLTNKENYSPTQVKRANFAHNAAGWSHHAMGGYKLYPNGGTADGEPDLEAYWRAKANGTYNNGDELQYSDNGIAMNSLSDLPEDNTPLTFQDKRLLRTPRTNNINWGNVGNNAAMFAANNAGNIYNLSRYNKPEVETYDRMKASYLDPTAAIRDANQEARLAEYGVRNASGGNAANYLSNRVALNAQNVINKDRIRQQYGNANAGIGNQVNQFNTQLAQQETIANAQNRARTRSGKGEAIGSIGFNTANQMRDNKLDNMDQNTLDIMMKYYDTPAFKKAMKDNKFKK